MAHVRQDRKMLIMKRRVQRHKVKELEEYLVSMKSQAEQLNNDIASCEETLVRERAKLAALEREN